MYACILQNTSLDWNCLGAERFPIIVQKNKLLCEIMEVGCFGMDIIQHM